MEVSATLTGAFNEPSAQDLIVSNRMEEDGSMKAVSYNFKYFPAPEGAAMDYDPRLIRQETVLKPKEIQLGEGAIDFTASDYDPWYEVEVVKMLGTIYSVGDNSMVGGRVVAETGFMEFAPYAFLKWDMK